MEGRQSGNGESREETWGSSAAAEGEGLGSIDGDLRDRLRDLDREIRSFVHRYPVASLAGAITLGFLVGRVATRRR